MQVHAQVSCIINSLIKLNAFIFWPNLWKQSGAVIYCRKEILHILHWYPYFKISPAWSVSVNTRQRVSGLDLWPICFLCWFFQILDWNEEEGWLYALTGVIAMTPGHIPSFQKLYTSCIGCRPQVTKEWTWWQSALIMWVLVRDLVDNVQLCPNKLLGNLAATHQHVDAKGMGLILANRERRLLT